MVAQQTHDIEIMADEKVTHAKPGPQVCKQVQDNGLNGNIQSGSRFIKDQEIGIRGDCPGYADARLLPPDS